MSKLIAIGGGDETPGAFPKKGVFTFDKEIIKLSGKKHPKLLFIPTASKDAQGYIAAVENYFGKRLGCKIDTLLIARKKLSAREIKKKILDADIVYVGGGNTLFMIRKWKQSGIDKLLWQVFQKGTIMAGLSAGANCWFEHSTSDSRMITDPSHKDYIRVTGLGWYKLIMSPHHIREKRRKPALIKQVKKHGGIGIALDDYAALEIINDKFRIITAKPIAKAHKVFQKDGKIIYQKILNNRFFLLKDLVS